MPHALPLISTIAIGLSLALVMGVLAKLVRLPLIAGYLFAGIVLGPFTPGFVADQEIASELAEMGIILLMFGTGLHFHPRDLLAVKGIAVPGALAEIAIMTTAGSLLAHALGWSLGAGLIFGLSLSVASTVVLMRALTDRQMLKTPRGQIAVGWLVVEDLVTVIALVLIPPLSGLLGGRAESVPMSELGWVLLWTLGKVVAFIVLMLVVGRRVIPEILHYTALTGERELFRLSVLAVALGVAYGASTFFGVSFALGAFFAGMVMSGSTLSAQAAKDVLPFRDAFAVLFFVSVGMLFNPAVLVTHPLPVLATIGVIILGKPLVAFGLTRLLGHDRPTAATIAASLAQIGEFSFILIAMGSSLGILPAEARDYVVAAALVSIVLNPLAFNLLEKRLARA
jgi:monovalent cation:H+ antiporter-2, CPA2 family